MLGSGAVVSQPNTNENTLHCKSCGEFRVCVCNMHECVQVNMHNYACMHVVRIFIRVLVCVSIYVYIVTCDSIYTLYIVNSALLNWTTVKSTPWSLVVKKMGILDSSLAAGALFLCLSSVRHMMVM